MSAGDLMRRGKSPHDGRYEIADLRCGSDFFRARARHRHVARSPFLKQKFGSPDDRLGMKTVLISPLFRTFAIETNVMP